MIEEFESQEEAVNAQYVRVCAAWREVIGAVGVAEEKRILWRFEVDALNELMKLAGREEVKENTAVKRRIRKIAEIGE